MIYILFFCIAIVAITITKFAVPFILSRARISHHLVATVNFFLNIAVLLSTFFVLFFLLQFSGVIDNTNDIEGEQHETTIHTFENKKGSNTSKLQDKLAKGKEDERIEQEREKEHQRELEAEKERRIKLEKQRRLDEEKKRKRLQEELEAEKKRRIELEKQQRLDEEQERIKQEQERLRKLEEEKERLRAENERQRIELEKQRRLDDKKERERRKKERRIKRAKQRRLLAKKKERERREKERLRKLKSPCEKIKDSLDTRFLNYAIRKANNEMTILPNRQGVNCYITPTGMREGCITYQIEQEGNLALCFYEECTER